MEAVDIKILREAFMKSWSRETSYPKTREKWNKRNPMFGQCAVTSLVVNDLFGGKIVYNTDYHHYWNVLENGTVIDLTKEQFGKRLGKIEEHGVGDREYLLYSEAADRARTLARYNLLKSTVERNLLLLVE